MIFVVEPFPYVNERESVTPKGWILSFGSDISFNTIHSLPWVWQTFPPHLLPSKAYFSQFLSPDSFFYNYIFLFLSYNLMGIEGIS